MSSFSICEMLPVETEGNEMQKGKKKEYKRKVKWEWRKLKKCKDEKVIEKNHFNVECENKRHWKNDEKKMRNIFFKKWELKRKRKY